MADMTMLEKMARAMAPLDHPDDWGNDTEQFREAWREAARAALEAIREPSEEMKAAGERALDLPEVEPEQRRRDNAGEGFTAMIDAILQGKA